MIAAIKAVHSAYFLTEAFCLLHLVLTGLRGRATRLTRVAVAGVLVEGAIWLLNRRRCPLTGVVEDLGAAHGSVSDIFLPAWFARRIPQLSAAVLAVGALAALLRRVGQRAA